MAPPGESGRITISWTRLSSDDGQPVAFDWSVDNPEPRLSDDEIEALLTEIAASI